MGSVQLEIRTRAKLASTVDISFFGYNSDWRQGAMPVPVWEDNNRVQYESRDFGATVVSEDIWKKFGLDYYCSSEKPAEADMLGEQTNADSYLLNEEWKEEEKYEEQQQETEAQKKQREREERKNMELLQLLEYLCGYDKVLSNHIRHDCMWAGSCLSKEHRSTWFKINSRVDRIEKIEKIKKIVVSTAGRSLLIPRLRNSCAAAVAAEADLLSSVDQRQPTQQKWCSARNGDANKRRLETPPQSYTVSSEDSSSESEEEEEEEVRFLHDIDIHERLSECISEPATRSRPALLSEVTDQRAGFYAGKKTKEENQRLVKRRETNIRNTLSDHSYYLMNHPIGKNVDHLGVQTPSDSAAVQRRIRKLFASTNSLDWASRVTNKF